MAVRVVRGQQSDDQLKLSFDRKVSPTGTWQESRARWIPTTPNSFGLPAGDSCPGKTEFCTSCYAQRSEQSAGVAELVDHNLALLRAAGTVDAMTDLLDEMIWRYRQHALAAGHGPPERLFRIHWDGDFYSIDYARAWATVIDANDDVQFWAYTRSFVEPVNVVPVLADLDNLALYLSIDAANAAAAREVMAAHPGVLAALCGPDYQRARALAPDLGAVVCPENVGRIPLMAKGAGACVTCRLCPDSRRSILFSTSHLEDASVPVKIRRPDPAPGEAEPQQWPCGNPECETTITWTPGTRGRPPEYCRRRCQTRARYLRQR